MSPRFHFNFFIGQYQADNGLDHFLFDDALHFLKILHDVPFFSLKTESLFLLIIGLRTEIFNHPDQRLNNLNPFERKLEGFSNKIEVFVVLA
jgi:hypothetical protein